MSSSSTAKVFDTEDDEWEDICATSVTGGTAGIIVMTSKIQDSDSDLGKQSRFRFGVPLKYHVVPRMYHRGTPDVPPECPQCTEGYTPGHTPGYPSSSIPTG